MKKSSFITLILGTISCLLFSIGMCMCLLPEWGTFDLGLGFGGTGLVGILITILVYRKLTNKAPIHLNGKMILKIIYGIFACLVLGAGMAMVLALDMMIEGIIVGIVGIVLILLLIPMCFGLKE